MSTDSGASWLAQFVSTKTAGRIGLGVGPGGVAYAALADCPAGKLIGLEKSTDYGSNWSAISLGTAQGLTDYFTYPGTQNSQGSYDNVVAVDPSNASNAAFGGIDVLITTNGGSNFTNVTDSYRIGVTGGFVHPDNHAILFIPTRGTSALWVGNDGGVFQSTDLGGNGSSSDWVNRNSNLNTIQFYQGTALSAARYLGGSQDNGTSGNLPGAAALPSWQGYWVGDGGYTAIDAASTTIYAENPPVSGLNLSIQKGSSTITGSASSPYDSFSLASPCSGSGGTDPACSEPASWTPPFLMDPANPQRLIAATNRLYVTTSGGVPAGTAGKTTNGAWTNTNRLLAASSQGFVTALAMGPAGETSTIFTGSNDGAVFMTTDSGTNWTNITGSGLTGSITSVAFNPFNVAEAWVTTDADSNGVFHTTNAGASTIWSPLGGITAKANSLVLDRYNTSTIYVGTDIGAVVCTTCGGSNPLPNWAPFGTGLPNVQVLAVTLTRDGKNVIAWTHGRGAWSTSVLLNTTCMTNTVAGGTKHSVALDSAGRVFAWGDNTSGELGNGTNASSTTPVLVSTSTGLPTVASVAAGNNFTVARTSTGAVWSWGDNSSGGLGNTKFPSGSNLPVQVQGQGGAGVLNGISTVSAGQSNFAVAVRASDGSVWTWGDNSYGELGNGGGANSPTPVQVRGPGGVGFLTGIVQVAAGGRHIVALKADGTVWAWGENDFGELGSGSASTMAVYPVQVVGQGGKGVLSGVISIGTHSHNSLAVVSQGTVYSWGNNQYGQLGTGKVSTYSASPVLVATLSGLTVKPSVTTGWEHSLAADPSTGNAWAWGWNVYGQLGTGNQTQALTPVRVTGSTQYTEVAAGSWHSLAASSDGSVWAWGDNTYGELGNGQSGTTTNPTPGKVLGVTAAQPTTCFFVVPPALCLTTTIAGGSKHSVALDSTGHVFAWGDNTSGELGNGTNTSSTTPVPVSTSTGLPVVSSVSAGANFTVVRTTAGTVWSWGDNSSGGLGNSNFPGGSNLPVQVQDVGGTGFLSGVASVSAGSFNFAVATKASDGSVWAWGENTYGELGNGGGPNSTTPVQVKGPGGIGYLTGVVQVVAGGRHVVALKADGTVWTWGENDFGELGDGAISTMEVYPVQVVGPGGTGFLTGVIAIGTHSHNSIAVLANGSAYGWGNNQYGQLGNGTVSTYSATPVQVATLSGLTNTPSITTGWEHSLAADPSTGKAWGWGWNVYGQLGNGTQTQELSPSPVSGTAQYTEMAAGSWHSLGLGSDGRIWTWGDNTYGELGNGSSGSTVNPTPGMVPNVTAAQRQAC